MYRCYLQLQRSGSLPLVMDGIFGTSTCQLSIVRAAATQIHRWAAWRRDPQNEDDAHSLSTLLAQRPDLGVLRVLQYEYYSKRTSASFFPLITPLSTCIGYHSHLTPTLERRISYHQLLLERHPISLSHRLCRLAHCGTSSATGMLQSEAPFLISRIQLRRSSTFTIQPIFVWEI